MSQGFTSTQVAQAVLVVAVPLGASALYRAVRWLQREQEEP